MQLPADSSLAARPMQLPGDNSLAGRPMPLPRDTGGSGRPPVMTMALPNTGNSDGSPLAGKKQRKWGFGKISCVVCGSQTHKTEVCTERGSKFFFSWAVDLLSSSYFLIISYLSLIIIVLLMTMMSCCFYILLKFRPPVSLLARPVWNKFLIIAWSFWIILVIFNQIL